MGDIIIVVLGLWVFAKILKVILEDGAKATTGATDRKCRKSMLTNRVGIAKVVCQVFDSP